MTTQDIPAATAEDHPHSTNPNWPALLEKYRALAQADWDANQNVEDLDRDAPKRGRRILERAMEDANDRLEDIVATSPGQKDQPIVV